MTLVLAAKNSEAIVVAADSFCGRADETDTSTGAQKLYKLRDDCVVLVAGYKFDSGKVGDFLQSLAAIVAEKELASASLIVSELWNNARRQIDGQMGDGNLVLLVAGFDDVKPTLWRLGSESSFSPVPSPRSYLAAGKDEYANERCEELGVSIGTSTSCLEKHLQEILAGALIRYPDAVGGEIHVEVLKPTDVWHDRDL